jgi:hypothetical protein
MQGICRKYDARRLENSTTDKSYYELEHVCRHASRFESSDTALTFLLFKICKK